MKDLGENIAQIVNVVDKEAIYAPHERIFLAGIGQGCTTAILTLILSPMRLAGFIGFSSWLPFEEETVSLATALKVGNEESIKSFRKIQTVLYSGSVSNRKPKFSTPVFLSHSEDDDDVVPVSNGEALYRGLRELGMDATRKTYPDGGHWISESQGVDDIVAFVQASMSLSN